VTSTTWIQFLLAAVACGVLLLASFAIVRFGKELKGQVSPSSSGGRRSGGSMRAPSISRDTYNMARKLKEQGVSTAALAGMSAAEQQFFLDTMSARLGEGTGPRLVRPPAGSTAAATAPAEAAPIPAAALVTGPIHCPVCRTVIGQRSEPGPTMQKCPGCSRRVTTKVEGDRLTVTVSYGMGTPAKGSSAIRPQR
jgi:hypothetical protein